MRKVVQINTSVNRGSTGVIAEGIGQEAIKQGWESWIAFGRRQGESKSNLIRIGTDFDLKMHGLQTRLFDNHGLASRKATKQFIEQLKSINPDIIHLHNIHGYYLNYLLLFQYLKEWGGPVVWTLHDCWPFTGHCTHYSLVKCDKWKYNGCHNCRQKKNYPSTVLIDNSRRNFRLKQECFTSLRNLTIVAVGKWLESQVRQSFLKQFDIQTIYNGADLNLFYPNKNKDIQTHFGIPSDSKIVLGVASVWTESKGLNDFFILRDLLPMDYSIVLVGLNQSQIDNLPTGMFGIGRTDNISELTALYSEASVYVNCSKEETLGMTTVEAQACGTPVVAYNSTGCYEPISQKTGYVVESGNVQEIAKCIPLSLKLSPSDCREHILSNFNKDDRFADYINLYNQLLS